MPGQMALFEAPWDDCKVAFGVDDVDAFEQWMEDADDGRGALPSGWSLCETDAAGAHYVAVFRVEGRLKTEDGALVRALIDRLGGAR